MMSEIPRKESGRSKERSSFKEQCKRIFTSEEIEFIAKHQIPSLHLSTQDIVILFRVSNPPKEQPPFRVRSWTPEIITVISYLGLRSIERLAHSCSLYRQNPELYSREFREEIIAANTPIIKITNKRSIPPDTIKPGIEDGELEIDENSIDQRNILVLSSVADIREFEKILLEQLDPESEEYRIVQYKFQEVIEQLQRSLDLIQALREDI